MAVMSFCKIVLWQQAKLVWADFRVEGVTVKLLQDLCDKQSLGSRAVHHFLGTINK